MSWEDKVQRVIGKLSADAYRRANTDRAGNKYRRHRPYRIPEEAETLVKCLGDRDRTRGEKLCKATMEQLRRAGVRID
jgi:hypothetical protein